MSNNEYFHTAISGDATVRNSRNIYKCMKMQALYNYLYMHYADIGKILNADENGNINSYNAHQIISSLHEFMCNQNATPAQAVKELYRIRKASDYK